MASEHGAVYKLRLVQTCWQNAEWWSGLNPGAEKVVIGAGGGGEIAEI